eukprot:gene7655-9891_t
MADSEKIVELSSDKKKTQRTFGTFRVLMHVCEKKLKMCVRDNEKIGTLIKDIERFFKRNFEHLPPKRILGFTDQDGYHLDNNTRVIDVVHTDELLIAITEDDSKYSILPSLLLNLLTCEFNACPTPKLLEPVKPKTIPMFHLEKDHKAKKAKLESSKVSMVAGPKGNSLTSATETASKTEKKQVDRLTNKKNQNIIRSAVDESNKSSDESFESGSDELPQHKKEVEQENEEEEEEEEEIERRQQEVTKEKENDFSDDSDESEMHSDSNASFNTKKQQKSIHQTETPSSSSSSSDDDDDDDDEEDDLKTVSKDAKRSFLQAKQKNSRPSTPAIKAAKDLYVYPISSHLP